MSDVFKKHKRLQSICNNTPGFPVAQHFNSTGHSISDVQVHGVALCCGTNIQRKQREMRLIFQLDTVQPKGLNINFSFIWIGMLYTSCALLRMSIILSSTVQQFFFTLKKGHKPETFVFFENIWHWYFFTNYYLIRYCFMGLFWGMDFDLVSSATLAITDKRNNSFPRTVP